MRKLYYATKNGRITNYQDGIRKILRKSKWYVLYKKDFDKKMKLYEKIKWE